MLRFLLFGSILLFAIPLIMIIINYIIYNMIVPIIIIFEEKNKRRGELDLEKMERDRDRARRDFEYLDKIVQRKKDDDRKK